MGLLDVLNGMRNGPRGQSVPAETGKGGMSPWMMALLGLLAYKAVKGGGLGNILGGGGSAPAPANDRAARGGGLGDVLGGMLGGRAGNAAPGGPGGGLGDLLGAGRGGGGLGGLLGGLLAGGAAGGILNGGLRNLVQDMQDNGQGDIAQSWISRGANREISPNELAQAAGADAIDQLAGETGLPRDELLSGLSQQLPELVDRLTPDGRLPTDDEASTWV